MEKSAGKRKIKWTEYVPQGEVTPQTTFYVCLVRTFTEDDVLGPFAARIVSTYGGDAIELPWCFRDRAYPIMTAVLRTGCPIFTQTRMCVNVRPDELDDAEALTPAVLERIVAKRCMQRLRDSARERQEARMENWRVAMGHAVRCMVEYYPRVYAHPACWITEEGKSLLEYMREYDDTNMLRGDSSDEEVDVDAWDPPLLTSPPTEAPDLKRPSADVDSNREEGSALLCVVCMERVADTLVLPCMHQCVCQACSASLRNTINAKRCVMCRAAIASVEIDEHL